MLHAHCRHRVAQHWALAVTARCVGYKYGVVGVLHAAAPCAAAAAEQQLHEVSATAGARGGAPLCTLSRGAMLMVWFLAGRKWYGLCCAPELNMISSLKRAGSSTGTLQSRTRLLSSALAPSRLCSVQPLRPAARAACAPTSMQALVLLRCRESGQHEQLAHAENMLHKVAGGQAHAGYTGQHQG